MTTFTGKRKIKPKAQDARKIHVIILSLSLLIINSHCKEPGKENEFNLSDVSYEVAGNGTPIIMIHGMGVDHRVMKHSFEPVFSELPDKWKRVYLDLPGMGQTKAFEWIKNSDDMVAFVAQFIGKVIPGEDFIVAGYSYGGYLARGLMCKHSI